MKRSSRGTAVLLGTTCLVSLLGVAAASAQDADRNVTDVDEIIVTATRSAQAINRVPLSITAVTQENLDNQGIRDVRDLARGVPGVRVSTEDSSGAGGAATISIRGISSGGAATTGVYLDDIPLSKRSGPRGSGAPLPQFFDLERVEVLRGPQGTLYGGGAQGGAVRFITPQPSLTDYSGYGRAEIANTEYGDLSYQLGLAVGGPIIEDRIGFRASLTTRHAGGWLDYYDRHTGDLVESDTNSSDSWAARLAVQFALTDNFSITPSIYYSSHENHDQNSHWLPVEQFTSRGSGNLPATTYGPYDFYGPYRSGDTCNVGDDYKDVVPTCVPKQPNWNDLFTASITSDYQWGNLNIRGVLSYIRDDGGGRFDFSYQEPQNHQGGTPFVRNLPLYRSYPEYTNTRDGVTGELRFSYQNPDSRLSWVAGVYYTQATIDADIVYRANMEELTNAIHGAWVFGVPMLPNSVSYYRDYTLEDQEIAVYGEANYQLTDNLKAIAGLRVSRTHFDYYQETAGPIAGTNVPTVANGGLISGEVTEEPISPKFGLQYEFDSVNQIYGTISKGYRVGGINQPTPSTCAADLASLGITGTPNTYESDTVWNYEVGAKVRLGGARVNVSAYRLEWSNVQTAYNLPTCGFGYTVNAGEAVSQGVDLDVSMYLFDNLSANLSVGYADASYTEGVVGPPPTNRVYFQEGDPLPIPEWNINLGLQYDFVVGGNLDAFIRADWQYSSEYEVGVRYGSAGYNPDTRIREATNFVSARAGVDVRGVQLTLFVDNLFNSQDVLGTSGGRTGCNITSGPECTVYSQYNPVFRQTTYRPRTVGVSAAYRF